MYTHELLWVWLAVWKDTCLTRFKFMYGRMRLEKKTNERTGWVSYASMPMSDLAFGWDPEFNERDAERMNSKDF